ncbi:hypothetical protein Vadar_014891 [Vaccinium darrowii]|nr:hypothetical protein Vadar_014891 [Vaccinium darrowii]
MHGRRWRWKTRAGAPQPKQGSCSHIRPKTRWTTFLTAFLVLPLGRPGRTQCWQTENLIRCKTLKSQQDKHSRPFELGAPSFDAWYLSRFVGPNSSTGKCGSCSMISSVNCCDAMLAIQDGCAPRGFSYQELVNKMPVLIPEECVEIVDEAGCKEASLEGCFSYMIKVP